MSFSVLIPARYASSRLPGKALADLGGKPMVVRVAERARESGAARVVVATDDVRIEQVLRAHGIDAVRTRSDHPTGTDRLAEAAARLALPEDDIVVNVQGDEPLLDARLMRRVAELLAAHADADIATACHAIADVDEAFNPNVVKVVLDAAGYALYFSRARIPHPRAPAAPAYRHVGLYAYRASFLREFTGLLPAPIERAEALEQLRALWHGHRIAMVTSETAMPPGVDTPEDLKAVLRMWR